MILIVIIANTAINLTFVVKETCEEEYPSYPLFEFSRIDFNTSAPTPRAGGCNSRSKTPSATDGI